MHTYAGFEKFEALPRERREALLKASVSAFAARDYPRVKTEDVARCAGISKGLLFFYFKNKRALYEYTLRRLTDWAMADIVDDTYRSIDDFFELFSYIAAKKRALCRRHATVSAFSLRAYCASEPLVRNIVNKCIQDELDLLFSDYLAHVRLDRFRDDVDVRKVVDMFMWLADGYIHRTFDGTEGFKIEAFFDEFDSWCAMLKRVSYKEEYL